MNKDNKINTFPDSVKSIPELIKNKKAYSLLISNRSISFRKKLAEKLDMAFTHKVSWNTWKSRFLYPEDNVPKKNAKEIATAMEEMTIWALQEQVDYLIDQKKNIDEIIEKSIEIINAYKNKK